MELVIKNKTYGWEKYGSQMESSGGLSVTVQSITLLIPLESLLNDPPKESGKIS